MSIFKSLLLFSVLIGFVFTQEASATYVPGGVYGGTQNCPYPTRSGRGSVSDSDELDDLKNQKKDLEAAKRALRKEIKALEKDQKEIKKAMLSKRDGVLKKRVAEAMFKHIEGNRDKAEYGKCVSSEPPNPGTFVDDVASIKYCTAIVETSGEKHCDLSTDSDPEPPFEGYCEPKGYKGDDGELYGVGVTTTFPEVLEDDGQVGATDICNTGAYVRAQFQNSTSSKDGCASDIDEYFSLYEEIKELEEEMSEIDAEVRENRMEQAELKRELRREQRELRREEREARSEGRECTTCYYAKVKKRDKWSVVADVGLTLLGGYAMYRGVDKISERNAELGWATDPYAAASIGYPFLLGGLYGAAYGGMGAGGFGCAGAGGPFGGMWGGGYGAYGGAFGYPGAWNPGGGIFNPGLGPWGANGPFVNGPYGYPGGAIAAGIGVAISGGIAPFAPYAGIGAAIAPYAGGAIVPYAGGGAIASGIGIALAGGGGLVPIGGAGYVGAIAPIGGAGYIGAIAPIGGAGYLGAISGGGYLGAIGGGAYAPYGGAAGAYLGAIGGGAYLGAISGGAYAGGAIGQNYLAQLEQLQLALQEQQNTALQAERLLQERRRLDQQLLELGAGFGGVGLGGGSFGVGIGAYGGALGALGGAAYGVGIGSAIGYGIGGAIQTVPIGYDPNLSSGR